MVRRLTLALLLLLPALGQGEKPLLAGSARLTAVYPLNRGVSYVEARPFARALGLGYLERPADVYLTLGARAIRLPVVPDAKTALARVEAPLALREGKRVLVPIKRVAKALGATYAGSEAGIRVSLPPARLLEHYLASGGGQEQLFLRFSRDVNLVATGPARFLALGAEPAEGFLPLFGDRLYGLELRRHPLGLELALAGAEGRPVRYAPYPSGAVFWVGSAPGPVPRPLVVVDGGYGARAKRVARALVARLRERGVRARLGGGATPAARAEAGARADVFVVLGEGGSGAVYTYRPRGKALALSFVVRAREALLLGGAPRALAREVAPAEASAVLAERLAGALGVPRGRAEIALLAWAPKAAALVELPPGGEDALAGKLAAGILAYLGVER